MCENSVFKMMHVYYAPKTSSSWGKNILKMLNPMLHKSLYRVYELNYYCMDVEVYTLVGTDSPLLKFTIIM